MDINLQEISLLDPNWDGYGASKFSEETVSNARRILDEFSQHLPYPDIAPNPNATVSYEWETESGLAHLEVGKTLFSLFIQAKSGPTLHYDGPAEIADSVHATQIKRLLYPEPGIPASGV